VNAKALSSYLGHASVTITYDRYGHLMPGSEDEAVKLVDDYIEGATGARTGAQGAETAPLRRLLTRELRARFARSHAYALGSVSAARRGSAAGGGVRATAYARERSCSRP
jgi:hypothetical protein